MGWRSMMKHVHPHDWPSLTFMVFHVASTSGSAGTQAIKLCSSYAQAMLKLCRVRVADFHYLRCQQRFGISVARGGNGSPIPQLTAMRYECTWYTQYMTEHRKYQNIIPSLSNPYVIGRVRHTSVFVWGYFIDFSGEGWRNVLETARWWNPAGRHLGSKLAAWLWLRWGSPFRPTNGI